MPLAESILMKIADKVFGYIMSKTGMDIKVRQILGLDPTKKAFAHALGQSYDNFKRQHPEWTAALFDSSFLENEGSEVIAQFLMPGGNPSASDLANHWAKSLNVQGSERKTIYVRELEPLAVDFLETLRQALVNEPNLRELADSRALQQLTNDLSAIRTQLGAGQATPGTRQDYLRWLIERNLYLDARGTLQTERQVQVKLDQVYISLLAQREYTPGAVDRRILEKELTELEKRITHSPMLAEEIEGLREEIFARVEGAKIGSGTAQQEVLELAAVITKYDRLVILGDPGSGKSTLLRYLALRHAQALWDGRTEVDTELGTARFPLLIRVADYVEADAWKVKPLSDYLYDACRLHECPGVGLADLLQAELAQGNCLIMLDGLDEIVNSDERRTVVERIQDFIRYHDGVSNRFVVTSRIAGYRSASLGEPFAHYTVQEMNELQIENFLQRWCPAVEASQTPDLSVEKRQATAQVEIDEIMEAVRTNPGVERLAANPLLLRTLALIHRAGAQLPQKRIELYKLAADTLARTWRISSGVSEAALALVKDEYLNPMLSKLAYWLHANKPTGIATEREVNAILGEEWARINGLPWDADDPNPAVKTQVDGFLIAVREHTGLFVERAPRRYGFMHLTFEEYYAARHLVARSRTRAKLIREHLHDARWDEPILLALGFVGLEYPDEAAELFDTAIFAEGEEAKDLNFSPSPHEELLGRDFLFALRCLADNIPTNPARMRHLIERLTQELIYNSGSAKYQKYRRLLEDRLHSLKGSKVTFHLVAQFRTALLGSLRDENAGVRARAAASLVRLGNTQPDVVTALLNSLRDENEYVRSTALRSIINLDHIVPDILTDLSSLLTNSTSWVTRMETADLIGSHGPDEASLREALMSGLLDEDNDVREACVMALAQLGMRFPQSTSLITQALIGTFDNPEFDSLDRIAGRSAHDYAFDGLWALITGDKLPINNINLLD